MKIKTTAHRKVGTNLVMLFSVQQRSDKIHRSSDKSTRRIKRKYYENHENTSCFVYCSCALLKSAATINSKAR